MVRIMPTVLLLLFSNVFMTFAWYYHLRFKGLPLLAAIGMGWGIAFFEYCLAVPANRLAEKHGWTLVQMKTLQEVLALSVFAAYAIAIQKEKLKWNHGLAAVLLVIAVCLVFYDNKH